MLLLPLMLVGALATQPPQIDRAEAERLVRTDQYAQALEGFRQIAAANPDDVDARVWIGKLHVLMGHAAAAVPIFQSVLDAAPDRMDALTGLGEALRSLGRTDEAIEYLTRAEKLAPNDPDILAAQGRTHLAAGNATLADAYLRRAAMLRPEDAAIAASVQNARRQTGNSVSATYMHESYSAAVDNTRFGSFGLSYRANDRVRVTGRVDVQQKFFREEARGGGGLTVRATPLVTLRGEGLFGGTTEVFPRGDVNGAVDLTLGEATISGSLRYLRFASADYWVFTPAITVTRRRAVFAASFPRSMTGFDGIDGSGTPNSSATLSLNVRVRPRLWLGGGYSRNIDRLDMLSPDRLGDFKANTGTALGRLELRSSTTLGVDYDYQKREDGVTLIRILGSFVQRF